MKTFDHDYEENINDKQAERKEKWEKRAVDTPLPVRVGSLVIDPSAFCTGCNQMVKHIRVETQEYDSCVSVDAVWRCDCEDNRYGGSQVRVYEDGRVLMNTSGGWRTIRPKKGLWAKICYWLMTHGFMKWFIK